MLKDVGSLTGFQLGDVLRIVHTEAKVLIFEE